MSAALTLHLSPGSCSLGPHIILHHLSVPFSTNVISAKTGFPSGFSALNPKMRIPVLVLDEHVITEAPAILTALAQLKPELKLLGSSDLETVRCYEWLNYLSGYVHALPFGQLWRTGRFSDDETAFDGIKEKGRKNMLDAFEHIESRLVGREWCVGTAFTVVDAFVFVFWRWGVEVGTDMEEYPYWKGVMGRVVALEAVKKTLSEDKIASNWPARPGKL